MLHHLLLGTLAGVVLCVDAAGAQTQPSSLWQHNGSVVGLVASGNKRIFRYHEPKAELRERGVKRGTLLMEVTRTGDDLEGKAFVFSTRCGPRPYEVSGTVADDGKSIKLTGQAPTSFDEDCDAASFRDDVLEFFLDGDAPVDDSAFAKRIEAHITRSICEPVVKEGIAGFADLPKSFQPALTTACAKCFVDNLKSAHSRQEAIAFASMVSGSDADVSAEVAEQAQEKYAQVFAACSANIVDKAAKLLAGQ